MIRVLTDAIHADLWESLRILFEDRMGWELYAPHGLEWYEAGIWNFERANLGDAVARQFLQPWHDDIPYPSGQAWSRLDLTHPGQTQKRVTMEQARDLRPDIILSTLVENDMGWHGFAQEVGAHFGIQVGNQGATAAWGAAEFALLSVTTPGFTPWRPHVYYHQEFSLKDFAPDGGNIDSRTMATMVQCAVRSEGYPLMLELAEGAGLTPLWYGHCGDDDGHWGGNAPTTPAVAQNMHDARLAYHWKRWSDGYGHVIHNWASIGRPLLTTATYYADKLAAPLFVEGVTSFDLERHTTDEMRAIVQRLAHDDSYYQSICEATAARFREVVDFDSEAEAIGSMLADVMA